ncbi:hypothetical protein, partial [Glaesserella parasuis]|uniref:VG15 protein n=1 Tax=Glaesserella parasuis TaxID=738 RepID=UPI003F3556F6
MPEIAEHAQQAQIAAVALAERAALEVTTLWPDLEGMDYTAMKAKLLGIVPTICEGHREAAAGLAADWYETARPKGAPRF